MNRDLFREISLHYLPYKSCKRLSLAFKDANVLSRNEKLAKYFRSRGIEYCIERGYYDGFVELFRALKPNNPKRRLTPARLFELARDASQILIFDFIWNQYHDKTYWKSQYVDQFVEDMFIKSNLDFIRYFYREYTEKRSKNPFNCYDTDDYFSSVTPQQLDFAKYDFLHHVHGGTGTYVIFKDCLLKYRDVDWFNELIKRDLQLSVMARAHLTYYVHLVKQHFNNYFPFYILSIFVLYQLVFAYFYPLSAITSVLSWCYLFMLVYLDENKYIRLDKYIKLVICSVLICLFLPIFIAGLDFMITKFSS